jgi:plasmid stabilization system protein ParE
MRAQVLLTEAAREHVRRIDDWWYLNRPAAPTLFTDELERGLDLIAESPGIGRRYAESQIPGVRRLYLAHTRHHVYYVHDAIAGVVAVLAIWSSLRERPPL